MVNCRYTVTADIYEDLIELQIRLKNRTPSQQLKFWGLNVGFLIAAILSCCWNGTILLCCASCSSLPLQQQRVAGPFGCFSRGCRQNEPSADT